MKNLVDYFSKKGKVFKVLEEIEKSQLKIRKKMEIYCATDISGNYHVMYVLQQKSRFLTKDVETLMQIDEKVKDFKEHNFKFRHFLRQGQTCSKAKELLKNKGWKIHNAFM